MTDFPDLKLKVMVTFPGSVQASSPIILNSAGGIFTFGFDVNALRASIDPLYINATGDTMTGDLVQRPAASVTPVNNGDLVVQATSNTSLTFKLKGSDGVIRSGSLTLA